MLAGLPNAPSVHSPKENPELAEQRMRQVLDRMKKCDVISDSEAIEIMEDSFENIF